MWKIAKAPTTNLLIQITLTLVFSVILWDTALGLSDKRLCADEKCKEIISFGTATLRYYSSEKGVLSFQNNAKIRIKSKSAGSDLSLWGVEINGREGYAPKKFIKETQILIPEKDLKYVVDVVNSDSEGPAVDPVVLNASEVTVETTTTKPLEDIVTHEEAIISNPVENASTERPEIRTPVQQEIIVDGTRIPTMTDNMANDNELGKASRNAENELNESVNDNEEEDYDDEDDEIGDYDDDDEEDQENSKEIISTGPTTSTPIHSNADNNNNNSKESLEALTSDQEVTTSSPETNIATETTTATPSGEDLKTTEEQLSTPQVHLTKSTEQVESVTEPDSQFSPSIDSSSEQLGIEKDTPQQQQQVPNNEEKQGIMEDGKPMNETNEALPTANEDQILIANNISIKQSLPDNNINADNTTEQSLPLPSAETETSQVPQDNIQHNNIQNMEIKEEHSDSLKTELPTVNKDPAPEETGNIINDSEKPLYQYSTLTQPDNNQNVDTKIEQSDSLITKLPIVNTVPAPQEIENIINNQYSAPAQPENAQTIPDLTQNQETTSQPELMVTEKPELNTETQSPPPAQDDVHSSHNTNEYVTTTPYNPYDYDESSNTPLPPQYIYNNPTETPQPVIPPHSHYDYAAQQSTGYASVEDRQEVKIENPQHISPSDTPSNRQPEVTTDQDAHDALQPLVTPEPPKREDEADEAKMLPSQTSPPISVEELDKKDKGLFATIMDTVNNILPNNKKSKYSGQDKDDNELNKILYPDVDGDHKVSSTKNEEEKLFCEKLGANECPYSHNKPQHSDEECVCSLKSLITTEFTFDTFVQALASKVLEISELLAFLSIVAATILFFVFGYYCFCNSSCEGALLAKLNMLESSLIASHKAYAIQEHNMKLTKQKLASIEDNSFGSNDMVVSIKKELEEELVEKARLQEQITALQKELETAADAGIELNKIVSELLSNQTGDESIISSVEELQKQLNEQQNTILEINASLAEKSRENSELQLMIAEQNARYEQEISNLQRDNDELEAEKFNLQARLEEVKTDFDKDITAALEGKNFEIKRLQNEIVDLSTKVEAEHTRWQTSMAKVEALEECLKNVKRDPNINITQVIDVANVRAELLDAQKKYATLKERLELELDARKLSENQLQIVTAEVEKLKQDFNQSEKDKLEAQTRLEVLSNYFKDKENQLQKELSLKETMWLQQQGETTTTVDRLTTMQEEIQSLKSQNDALRAEIEAQVAAHKAQTGTLENRAHETWLAARQSDRRYEEARAEATALRRKLTALAGGNVNEANKPSAGPAGLGDDLTNAPSPIHMESPGSPMLGRMPPPPFLPPPFMGPPPPFMGMPPPPPFVPPGEMRPAPLGRIMSPPPPPRSGHLDYEDYLDYEGNNAWHRHHTYSPSPRTYRSLSPTDSRYNYGTERDLMSTYDTETDFSPPPSPRESRRRGGGGGYGSDKGGNSNSRNPYINSKKASSTNKGNISSGSDKSYNSSSKQGSKSKNSGGGGGGGKSLV